MAENEVYITFTVTREYHWNGLLTDLPAAIRKGVVNKAGEVDDDSFYGNVDDNIDSLFSKLEKGSDLQDETIELNEAGEA